MLRAGLLAHGVDEADLTLMPSEVEAIETALGTAATGDLLVIFADELARSWKQIIYHKKAEREALVTAKPAREPRPAPEFEELMSASDQLVRDERGVRLARVETEEAD